jgi:hypothetical protein
MTGVKSVQVGGGEVADIGAAVDDVLFDMMAVGSGIAAEVPEIDGALDAYFAGGAVGYLGEGGAGQQEGEETKDEDAMDGKAIDADTIKLHGMIF